MKRLYLMLLCFCAGTVAAQQFVVANMKENIVYCGVDNSLSALVESYPCSSVVLTIDNGKIKRRGCSRFNYRPAKVGYVRIKVWVKKGQKLRLLDSLTFQSRPLPMPVAFLTVYEDGRTRPPRVEGVYKISLRPGITGIRAMLANFNYQAPFQIVSYDVTVLRDNEPIFTANNSGAIFTFDVTKYFDTLQTGDQLLISDILCKGPDKKGYKLAPLEFKIIE